MRLWIKALSRPCDEEKKFMIGVYGYLNRALFYDECTTYDEIYAKATNDYTEIDEVTKFLESKKEYIKRQIGDN